MMEITTSLSKHQYYQKLMVTKTYFPFSFDILPLELEYSFAIINLTLKATLIWIKVKVDENF